ncbi:UNVERIFIED_CONTAM: hypothetical protein FKN15_029441 [Acipenser sinensis]
MLKTVAVTGSTGYSEGAVDSLTADPALLLIVVGSLMFIITFFGCFGALRDALNLLNIFAGILVAIIVLQIAAAALGFVFSDLVLTRTEAIMRRGITTYRDDLDLQNLIDFVQKKVPEDTVFLRDERVLCRLESHAELCRDECVLCRLESRAELCRDECVLCRLESRAELCRDESVLCRLESRAELCSDESVLCRLESHA